MASLTAYSDIYSADIDHNMFYTFSTAIPTDVRIDSITYQQEVTSLDDPNKGTWTLSTSSFGRGTKIGTISDKSVKDLKTKTTFTNVSYNSIRGEQYVYVYSTADYSYYASARLALTVNYTANSTYWSSTSTLSLSRSGTSVTATKGGTAVNSWGSAVTYYLYEGSTKKGTFSGNTLTLSNVSVGEHTYKVVASAGGLTADGKSASITVPANSTYWSSTSTLSLSRSGASVTATKGGTAVNSWGSTVTYYLYEGSTNKGTFSGNTLTLSNVSAGEHTYKVVASAGGKTADGASKSVTVPAAAITWSNATLKLAQSDTTVTATKGGTATHNYGTAVTYYLYEGSTKIGTFSGNTLSFTPSVGAHTYKTVASGGGISKDGASASITVVSPHKTLKIYSSSGWVECIIYRYNGSSFIEVEPYYYDGTNWSECSHT